VIAGGNEAIRRRMHTKESLGRCRRLWSNVPDDPTNAARQARLRKMRAAGFEHVEGWLPPKRAAKVRQWIEDEAEKLTAHEAPQKVTRLRKRSE
jgi:hypothetical protein